MSDEFGQNKDFARILGKCLDAVVEGRATPESCADRYPDYHDELLPLLKLAQNLPRVQAVQPSLGFRKQASARLQRRITQSSRPPVIQKEKKESNPLIIPFPWRRLAFRLGMVVVLLFGMLGLGGGAAYASDGAVPGDALYGIDTGVESLRLQLARTDEERLALRLENATERLSEAQILSDAGSIDLRNVALDNYLLTVGELVLEVSNADFATEEVVADVDMTLTTQEASLAALQASSSEKYDACSRLDHPAGLKLSEEYGMSYEQVMALFCGESGDHLGFGEVKQALKASEESGVSLDEVLDMRASGLGWGQIKQDLGVIGSPDTPPGQEDKEDKDNGPPDTPPGQEDKEDKDNGPPDTPPGQEDKEDKDNGPSDTPPGQEDKEDKDNGPPDIPPGQEDKEDKDNGPPDTPPGQDKKDDK